MKKVRTISQLQALDLIEETEVSKLEEVAEKFSVALTPQILSLIEAEKNAISDLNCLEKISERASDEKWTGSQAIQKQFLPDVRELEVKPEELSDPIADFPHSPINGIVHRHRDRCLLKIVNVCEAYCRFCFRREQLGSAATKLSEEDLEKAFQYIESHSEIWEVILTGGDPLVLKSEKLSTILSRLDSIPHIEVIRIHSRLPIHAPQKITPDFVEALKTKKPLYLNLHINHPQELTKETEFSLTLLHQAGISLISSTVLLKEVNDNIEVLEKLMRRLVQLKVKPYYLHHLDLAAGTSHFRVSIQTGQTLMRELRKRASGLCQPTYVLDIPGGYGKVPISQNYLCETCCTLENGEEEKSHGSIWDFNGQKHCYPPQKK